MDFTAAPVTILLIAANVIFSLFGFTNQDFLRKMIGWPYYTKKNNEYYRFISSGFLHADFIHLFFNMFTLFFFGTNIEITFARYGLGGTASYLFLYFLGMIVADIPSYLKHQDDPNFRTLGASGAVAAVLFASIVFDPWSTVELYGFISLYAILFAVLYIAYCVYMGKQNRDNVNHDAHLWGSLFGVAFTLAIIAALQPEMFDGIMNNLLHPPFLNR